MSVRLTEDAVIALEGVCSVDDAEPLLRHLLALPHAAVDWRLCDEAHTAVIQILLASKAELRGPPRGGFLREVLEPSMKAQDELGISAASVNNHRLRAGWTFLPRTDR